MLSSRLAAGCVSAALTLFITAGSDAATRRVCASGCDHTDVQAAIDAAQPGDTILLRAGQTFTGQITLKRKSGTGVILIRSDAPDADLPAAGVRLVPYGRTGANTSLSKLARLRGRGGTWRSMPLIQTETGAHHYRLQFLHIDGGAQEGYSTLIQLGNNTTQTSTSLAPYSLTLDRVYVQGDPVRGQKRCLALDSASTDILNSYFADCKHFANDAQAIGGFNGPGPFRIVNNYLEGSTENILFGGSDPKIPNLVPSDITIARNHITKNTAWRNPILRAPGSPRVVTSSTAGSLTARTHYFKVVALLDSAGSIAYSVPSSEVSVAVPSGTTSVTVSWSSVPGATRYRIYRGTTAGGENVYLNTPTSSTTFTYKGSGETSGTPPKSGTLWNVKSLIQLKNARRVTIEGNLIEHVWHASQTGFAIKLTPRNQGNTAPWTAVQDITIRYNTIRRVNGGINALGRDYSASTGSQQTQRINILHNVFDDVGGTWGSGAQWLLFTLSPSSIKVDHNTVYRHSGHVVMIDDGQSSGFVFTNNLARHNEYGVFGSGSGMGTKALTAYFPNAVFRRNVLAGGPASAYPTDNFFPSLTEFQAQFVNAAAGDYRLVSGSLYVNRATDGTNIGADMTALAAAQKATAGLPSSTTNAPPSASAGGPYTTAVSTALAVDGSGSRDSDGTIASYRWEWGDGSAASTGVRPSHTYTSAGTYTIRLTVTDDDGATASATTTATVGAATSGAGDIVLTSADVSVIRGAWAKVSNASAAGGQAMASTERGWWKTDAPAASPANYFEIPFQATGGTSYRLWLRMRAPSKSDDSVWVQSTGAVDSQGNPLWRTGSTSGLPVNLEPCSGCQISGWGWQEGSYWMASVPTVRFESTGPQTLRIQTREDGVAIDQIVLSPVRYVSTAPGAPTNDGTILPRTAASLRASGIVLRADDTVLRRGNWVLESDSTAADGRRLSSVDRGWSSASAPLASPTDYVEATFTAVAGVQYRTWLRLSATGNSKWNDSVWLQYDGSRNSSGATAWRIGTTSGVVVNRQPCSGCTFSGWGWKDGAYWVAAGTVSFATSGTQRIRIQTREDGVRIDQVVISPDRYLSTAPGATNNDTTIVRPGG